MVRPGTAVQGSLASTWRSRHGQTVDGSSAMILNIEYGVQGSSDSPSDGRIIRPTSAFKNIGLPALTIPQNAIAKHCFFERTIASCNSLSSSSTALSSSGRSGSSKEYALCCFSCSTVPLHKSTTARLARHQCLDPAHGVCRRGHPPRPCRIVELASRVEWRSRDCG